MKYIKLKEVCMINMGQSPDSSSYNEKKEGIPFYQGNADFGEKYPITRVWCNTPIKIAQVMRCLHTPIIRESLLNLAICITIRPMYQIRIRIRSF